MPKVWVVTRYHYVSRNTFIRNKRLPSPNDAALLPRRRKLQLHRYEKLELNICLGSVIAESLEIFEAKICNRNHGLGRFLCPPVYCVGVLTPPQRHSANALAASLVVPCYALLFHSSRPLTQDYTRLFLLFLLEWSSTQSLFFFSDYICVWLYSVYCALYCIIHAKR